jgi:DNA replication protein DnaC
VANRYERASLIVSSNKPFSAWTEIFGDAVAVAAMVNRLVLNDRAPAERFGALLASKNPSALRR